MSGKVSTIVLYVAVSSTLFILIVIIAVLVCRRMKRRPEVKQQFHKDMHVIHIRDKIFDKDNSRI